MVNRLDVEKTERFVQSSIMSKFPEFTISKADPFYDLFIRVFTLSTLVDILKLVQTQEDALGYTNFSLPEESYDKLLNRWFKNRIAGVRTTLSVRLFFDVNTNLITIRTSDSFSIQGREFNPSSSEQIFKSSYKSDADPITGDPLFYIDIPLQSVEVNSTIVVSSGSPVSLPYSNMSGFVRAVVNPDIISGRPAESNEDAYNRLQRSIGTDNWVNINSFDVNFSESLPGLLKSYTVVGHGEPEMYRDALYSKIPVRKISLQFSEKEDIVLKKRNEDGVLVTTLLLNNDSNVVYTLAEDVTLSKNDPRWKESLLGYFYFDIDVTLLSLSNPYGFVEDLPVAVKVNVIDNLTNEILYPVDLTAYHPGFLGAVTKTEVAPMDVRLHVGGFTDTYVHTDVIRVDKEIVVTPGSGGVLAIPSELIPVLKVVEVVDAEGVEVSIWNLVTGDPKKRYSREDDSYLYVDSSYEGRVLRVSFLVSPYIALVHDTVKDPEKRITQDNNVVKLKTPVFIDALIEVKLNSISSNEVIPALKSAFSSYTDNLTNTNEFNLNKVLTSLDASVPEEVLIESLTVTGVVHLPNGEENYLEGDVSLIVPDEFSLGVSSRTIQFITENVEIVLV